MLRPVFLELKKQLAVGVFESVTFIDNDVVPLYPRQPARVSQEKVMTGHQDLVLPLAWAAHLQCHSRIRISPAFMQPLSIGGSTLTGSMTPMPRGKGSKFQHMMRLFVTSFWKL